MSNPQHAGALDPTICEQARLTRDRRFDGLFFTAVRSTGIYCRPICPAPTVKAANVEYFANAASAAAAGYRPCLRCRPEAAPGTPMRTQSFLVAAALRLIEDGILDSNGVGELARRIGIGERHLRRLFIAELGAGPLDIASTRRLLFAKKLLTETSLPVTQVGLSAGYRSLRRFNAAFQASYKRPPLAIRRGRIPPSEANMLTLCLPYRQPYDFSAMLDFLSRTAISGVERIDRQGYSRCFSFDGTVGIFRVTQKANEDALELFVDCPQVPRLQDITTRVRRMFDLDVDIVTVNAHLERDPFLRKIVREHPGHRLPGSWDGFEVALSAVLGQHFSIASTRTIMERLAQEFGTAMTTSSIRKMYTFPEPERISNANLCAIGVTEKQSHIVKIVAEALRDGSVSFRPEQGLEQFIASWMMLAGTSRDSAHYIAMRAMSNPDAYPVTSLPRRSELARGDEVVNSRINEQVAEAWRPWRAYAALNLQNLAA